MRIYSKLKSPGNQIACLWVLNYPLFSLLCCSSTTGLYQLPGVAFTAVAIRISLVKLCAYSDDDLWRNFSSQSKIFFHSYCQNTFSQARRISLFHVKSKVVHMCVDFLPFWRGLWQEDLFRFEIVIRLWNTCPKLCVPGILFPICLLESLNKSFSFPWISFEALILHSAGIKMSTGKPMFWVLNRHINTRPFA